MGTHTVGEWIRASRKAQTWNQTQVGEMLGVSQVQVSQWETGKATPSDADLAKLEALFGHRPTEEAEVTNAPVGAHGMRPASMGETLSCAPWRVAPELGS